MLGEPAGQRFGQGRDLGSQPRHRQIGVLDGVTFEVAAGACVGILGHNGMGKSTLLKAIMGLLPATAGTIAWRDQPIGDLPAHRRARLGLGYVPYLAYHLLFQETETTRYALPVVPVTSTDLRPGYHERLRSQLEEALRAAR